MPHAKPRPPKRPRLLVEELEPRILYSADAAALLGLNGVPGGALVRQVEPITLLASTEPVVQTDTAPMQTAAAPAQEASAREIVFIDSRVSNAMQLVDELMQQRGSGRDFDIVTLHADEDGIAQINRVLANEHGLAAIHIISHGTDGAVLVGSTRLDAARLALDGDAIARWGQALSVDGDLLLYGCNVAREGSGQLFLHDLGQLTGADVAASTDSTGSASIGGNWTLEFSTGTIHTQFTPSTFEQLHWAGVLTTYTVTNNNDSGAGSLRQAILDANANAGADLISFNIAGTGVHTIAPTAALPTIQGQVTIDATTDDSFAANANRPAIILAGTNGLTNGLVLTSTADGSVIRGLVIRDFGGDGISIQAGSDSNVIAGNYIGRLTTTGADAGGGLENAGAGVYVAGSNNVIGGTAAADRNVISGNVDGVRLTGASANTNTVLNNYIGVNVAGAAAIVNTGRGVYIDGGASGNIIGQAGYGNVISGSTNIGVHLVGGTGNVIKANTIGLNAAGTAAISNGAFGLAIDGGASGTIVGGTGAGEGNLISGNTGTVGSVAGGGIYIQASNSTIQGNIIGLDYSGTTLIANGRAVANNAGIYLFNGSSNNLIGGATANAGNTIAGNTGDGIMSLVSGASVFTALGNRIYSNTEEGIDLTEGSVAVNDAGDADTGVNNLQNFPLLTSANSNAAGTTIVGTINSNANTTLRIEFFGNRPTVADAPNGEGERFLGFITVTTDGSGNASVNTTLANVWVNSGDKITATATVDLGGGTYGSTSEFAANVTATSTGIIVVDTTSDVADGTTTSITNLGNARGADGRISLREAIIAANNTANGGTPDKIVFAIPVTDANHVYYRDNAVVGTFSTAVATTQADASITDFDADYATGTARSWYRITLGTADLNVTQAVVIDGSTQAGYDAAKGPIIEIKGGAVTASDPNTITLTTGASTIRGLVVNGAVDNAIEIDVGADASVIVGNYFGTDVSGTKAVGNSATWGAIAVKATGVIVGGTTVADRNLISGNTTHGIEIYGSANLAVIQGNYIGTTVTGSGALGNGTAGIYIRNAATDNSIGGTGANEGNLIANNGGDGIWVDVDAGAGNRILGNTIYSNTGQAIDLGANGITANDAAPDADTGPNNLQNFPVLTSANSNSAGTTIAGTLTSNLSTTYRIEFYANRPSVADASNGEGERYLGFINVTTNGSGVATISTTLANVWVNSGDRLTATATNLTTNDTSEFGANVTATSTGIIVVDTVSDVADGTTTSITNLGNARGADGRISLREAIIAANATANGGTPDRIVFAIPAALSGGVHTINVGATGLPTITQAVIIDGTTEPDYAGTPMVELNGGNLGTLIKGITLGAGSDGSTISGLIINRFTGTGIEISGSSNHTIQGNWIGLDKTGTAAAANGVMGIYALNSTGNLIGGTSAAQRNVISGNAQQGVYFDNVDNSTISGNYVGTNVAGTGDVTGGGGNTLQSGVFLTNGSSGNVVGGTTAGARNVLSGNNHFGFEVLFGSQNNLLQGNYIGTDATGLVALGNINGGAVFWGAGTGNVFGGNVAGARNVIAGNTFNGVLVGNASTGASIQGNYIGVGADGVTALGNGANGISVEGASTNTRIGTDANGTNDAAEQNVIAGNSRGIYVTDAGTTGTVIAGNLIGLAADGNTIVANTSQGISVVSSAGSVTIGGATSVSRNVISGNASFGIYLGSTTSGSSVLSNYIGTNAAGTAARGNLDGVWIDGSANNIIGQIGAGNVISGSTYYGVTVDQAAATGNVIRANLIGLDATGTTNLGNGAQGIQVTNGASTTSIGGTTAGQGNTVAFNAGDGIYVSAGTGNSILGNSIHSNVDQGIDLGTSGVTANDVGDADSGANALQNFPVLATATTNGTQVTITGTFNSTASTTFRIEFFANTAADGSGYGEGQTYLGFANLTTDGSGNATINTTLTVSVAVGQSISATATNSATNNTSEFALCVTTTAANVAPTLTTMAAPVVMVNEDSQATVSFANLQAQGNEADVDGTVTAFVVKAVSSGTLLIGTSAGTATAWAAGTNDTVDATRQAYWTAALNANGTLNAFTVVAKDNGGLESATPVQVQVSVTAVNDGPTLSNLGGSPTYIEGGSPVVLDSDVAITDPELTPLNNFSGATLTLARFGGANANDVYSNTGTLSALTQGTNLVVGGATVGTVTTNSSGTLLLTFNGSATNALVNSVMQQITYSNSSDTPPASAQIVWVFNDGNSGAQGSGGAYQATAGLTVNITAVNDAPTLSATALNPSFTEAAGLGTQAAAVSVFSAAAASTIEAGQTISGLTFTVSGLLDGASEVIVVDGRTIALGANSSGSTVTNSLTYSATISAGTATIVLSGGTLTTAAAQTLVNGITYQNTNTDNPTAGNRVVTLTQVKDSGGTTNGGVDTTALSIASTVAVVAVNDLPTGAPVVSGTPTEDQVLGVNTVSIADAEGLGTFSYQWQRNGVNIIGATSSTYTLGDADVGTNIRVVVSYTDAKGTAESLTSAAVGPIANINDAPTGAPVVTGTPTEDQVLTANTGTIADADGLGAFSYQWQRNGVNIGGATGSTYTLGDADVGTNVRVVVSYTDAKGTAESLTSAAVGPIANVNDVPTGAPVVTGTPTEDQVLTVNTGTIADADGLGAFSYQWQRNGANIGGATASTYTLGDADVATNIRVIVSYTDARGTAESLTSAAVGPIANVNDVPTGAPVVTGTSTEDQVLGVNTGTIADADGLGAFSYQWQRNGVNIGGATASTYTLGDADVGTNIRVIVSYTDARGTAESLTSAAVGPIANVNDAPTGAPVVTGTPTEDQVLTANTGTIADADGLGAFSYLWQRNGANIGGATASTYTLGDADVGTNIRVVVSYTDAKGTTESLTSAAVGPVANVNDAPTGAPVVTGTPSEDQVLTAATGTIADADGLGAFSYQWQRNGVNIGGATASTYTLGDADVATNIRVIVSYTDAKGTAESLTSAAVGPIANINDAPTGAPVVTGTATEDQILTADTTTIADADGLGSFSYQWQRNGANIGGATASTYTLGDADVGTNIRVVVSYTDARGTAESLTSAAVGPIANVNDAPTLTFGEGNKAFTEGALAVMIDGLPSVSDLDSANFDTGSLTITISANASADDRVELLNTGMGAGQIGVSGANVYYGGSLIGTQAGGIGAAPFVVTFNASADANIAGEVMANIRFWVAGDAPSTATRSVEAVLTDGDGGTSITASKLISVTAVNDAPTGGPVVTGTPTEDQLLTASTVAIADADGVGAFSYQWQRNGANIAGATASTYTLGDADVGSNIRVVVSYTDGGGTAESLTSAAVGPIANVNDVPTGAPVVTGTPTEDQVLTASTAAIADADGLGAFSYQWQRNGVNIGGATASTYTLGDADVGTNIRVVVSYTDGGGTAESLTSAAVGPVANVNDVPTGAPVVAGTPTEDQVLTANTGTIADADGLGAFSYQWQRNGVNVGGATASTYTLGDADVGTNIRVVVSYTDARGTAESLTSAAVGPIANINDAPTGAPVVTGTPTEDQILTANTGTIADADGLGAFSYQWQRNGVNVGGATASTYTLGDADVGTNIRVVVSYTDARGTAESLTSVAVGPIANINDAPTGAPVVTGTATEDQVLTANTGAIADADGLGAFSYQWQRNGVNIGAATASTYTLGDADVGTNIRVVVSYTDGNSNAESLISAAVGPVANVNDAPTGAPVVTGAATEDQILAANTAAIADADGLGAFSYQWQRNGANILGATASTYTLGDTDVGTNIRVVVSYTDGNGTAESLISAAVGPVANINDAPTGAPVVTGTPTEDQTLTANTGTIADADGLGAFGYQWQRNGVNVGGANSSTYVLGDADVGTSIRVVVSYTDGNGTAESLTSAAVGPVANINDAPTGAPIVTGTATEDQVLTANTAAIADADGLGAFSYQWQRNGVNIGGATASTYTLGDADAGTNIRVVVSYTDAKSTAETLASAVVGPIANVNDAPAGAPVVSGTPTEDQTLTANTGTIADADGLGAFSYQWQRNGANIGGATASTYTLGDADVGTNIRVVVAYTDGQGTAESLTSAAVGPVANVNDAPTGAPVVTGTPTEDQVLTANTASIADADGLGAFSYQWQRNGVNIGGATVSTYTLGDADVGTNIRVVVSYTDPRGTAESLTSAAVGPVANINDVPTGAPVVTGTPTEDQTLTANTGTIADADDLGTFSYQWQRGGVNIAGATALTYTLGDADVGTNIRVVVSYTDARGTAESLTSAAVGPVANVNDAPAGAPVVNGTPTEDQILTANTGTIADADGLGAFSYQWQRNGLNIGGATASTYTLGDSDVGTNIRVIVSYTDAQGTAESLTSAAVGPVANVNDAPTGAPVVTGTPTEDQVLTANTGSIADADGLGAFSYQWQRNGVNVGGATASTYTLGDADVATNIRVVVSYTDARGTPESLTSAGIGPVTNVNDAPTTSPVTMAAIAEDSGARLITQAELLANAVDVDGPILVAANLAISGGGGTLVDNGNGTWSYTPAPGDDTAVSFNYTVTDGSLSAAGSATLDITPVNDAPAITSNGGGASASLASAENGTAVTTVSATDADQPVQILTYSIVGGADAAKFTVDSSTGALSFAAAPDFEVPTDAGADNIYDVIVRASDGSLGSMQAIAVTVLDVNEAPLAADSSGSVAEGAALSFSLAALGSDVDAGSNGVIDLAGAVVVSVPTQGNLVLNADGTATYTHNGSETTSDSFTYTLRDAAGLTSNVATVRLTVTPVNDAPTVTVGALSLSAGQGLVLDATHLSATDPDAATAILSFTVTDVRNGQFEWAATPGAAITQFAQADIAAGRVRFVSTSATDAPTFRVVAFDGQSQSAEVSATIVFNAAAAAPPVVVAAAPAPTGTETVDGLAAVAPSPPSAVVAPVAAAQAAVQAAPAPAGGGGIELFDAVLGRFESATRIERSAAPSEPTRTRANGDGLELRAGFAADDYLLGTLQTQAQDAALSVRVSLRTEARNESSSAVQAAPEEASTSLSLVETAQLSGLALTAGTVWWALRTGGLLTGLLVSLPAWRHADLLAVLPDEEDDDDWDQAEDDEAARDEQAVGQVLEPALEGEWR